MADNIPENPNEEIVTQVPATAPASASAPEHPPEEEEIYSPEDEGDTFDDESQTPVATTTAAAATAAAATAAAQPLSPLDKLNVKVDFHIGSITLPIHSLANLAPGWTLTDLPNLTFPKILAFSAGQAFAEGELVEIDGKIGFRITQILP